MLDPDQTTKRRRQLWLAAAIVAVLAAWLGVLLSPVGSAWRSEITKWLDGEPVIGGPFALVDQNGRPVTDRDLLGKPFGLFFGFTNCPDICPTTLYDISAWLTALGPDADKIRFAMVTVDPERDTQAALKSYMSVFDARVLALTGTQAEVDRVIRAYRVHARKVSLDGDAYTLDHSAAIYLMDANGRYWSVLSRSETTEAALAKLRKLINRG